MSLYREPGQDRRRRRTILAAGVLAAIVLVVVIVLISASDDSPSAADRAKDSRAAAAKALDGLELLQIEYAQAVRDGRVVEPTEYQAAQADVKRAQEALGDVDRAADPVAYTRARTALAGLEAAVDRRVAAARLKALVAQAHSALQPLAG